MTRLALLADIHGNLPALNAVMADLARFRVDQVVVAGDTVNWGPFSRETLDFVLEQRWAVIRGNNAFYALDWGTPRMPASWSAFTLPEYLLAQLGPAGTRAIASLPDSLSLRFPDAPPIRVIHASPGDPWNAIFPCTAASEVAARLASVEENHIVAAHSHIPLLRQVERWRIFNPGSVGVPLDGERSASYMIIDGDASGWHLVAHRRLPFDYADLYARFESDGFVQRCGITARLVIEEFRTARLQVYPWQRWRAEHYPGRPESDALLRAFQTLDDLRALICRPPTAIWPADCMATLDGTMALSKSSARQKPCAATSARSTITTRQPAPPISKRPPGNSCARSAAIANHPLSTPPLLSWLSLISPPPRRAC